jgi:hypothetical protein
VAEVLAAGLAGPGPGDCGGLRASGGWGADGRERDPLIPGQVAANISGLGEGPGGGDPLRHECVQCALQAGARLAVDHPPGDFRIRALLFRRVNVDTAEQGGFGVVEQRVVEGQVRRESSARQNLRHQAFSLAGRNMSR